MTGSRLSACCGFVAAKIHTFLGYCTGNAGSVTFFAFTASWNFKLLHVLRSDLLNLLPNVKLLLKLWHSRGIECCVAIATLVKLHGWEGLKQTTSIRGWTDTFWNLYRKVIGEKRASSVYLYYTGSK